MAKVTSKLQVTLPKALADQYGIRPGDEIDWEAAGEVIRVVPSDVSKNLMDTSLRLRLFDQATERQRERETQRLQSAAARERGWNRVASLIDSNEDERFWGTVQRINPFLE